jgi:hypothetical protein
MKKIYLIAFLIGFSFLSFSINTVSFKTALKDNKISYTAESNPKGTHYLGPILLTVYNNNTNELQVNLNAGDLFIPTESMYQNIVVTQSSKIYLLPNQKITIIVQGNCTESHDKSGIKTTKYTFSENSNIQLLKLAYFIDSLNLKSSGVQSAIWNLVNNDDYNTINSSDSVEELSLRKYVAKLQNKKFVLRKNDYESNYYYTPPAAQRIRGYFEYVRTTYVPQVDTTNIQIAMFDENNILVRELYNSKNIESGYNKIIYQFDGSVYKNDIYYFKMIVNYEVKSSKKFNIKAVKEQYGDKIQSYFLNQMFTGFGF